MFKGVILVKSWQTKIVRSVLMLMVVAATCFSLDAQDSERFERAGQEYTQMHYQQAYDLYQEISAPTATIYFNMGNCAFKLGLNGKALWHWRQAEERWGLSSREDLRMNLALVHEKLGHEAEKNGVLQAGRSVVKTVLSTASGMPLMLVQVQFLLFWTLLFVFVRKFLKQKQHLIIMALCTGVFLNGGLLIYRQIRGMYAHAIVLDKKMTLYAGPGTTYQHIGALVEGREVRIDRQRQDFYKIRAKEQTGWVERKALGVI